MEGSGPVQVQVGGHRVEATEQGRADGQRHGDGGWISWHGAVLPPARWSPVTSGPRLELLLYRQFANGRSTNRARPPLGPHGDIPPAEFEAQSYAQARWPDSTNPVSEERGMVQDGSGSE